MKRLLTVLLIVSAVVLAVFFLMGRNQEAPSATSPEEFGVLQETETEMDIPVSENMKGKDFHWTAAGVAEADALLTNEPVGEESGSEGLAEKNKVLHFKTEDGMAIVDGDIVLGQTSSPGGYAEVPGIILWPEGRVPFAIPSDLSAPARVVEAMSMFVDTPVQFVPYKDEEDVLVFIEAAGGCKSYVGKVGGKQPIWIGPQCSVTDIAHEIMHALGFIHEQNRSDRNQFVHIIEENIQEGFKINFEVFPPSMMKVSGLGPFDFQSIMIYSPAAFAKAGTSTMEARVEGQQILPSKNLSEGDLLRLAQAYMR
ncbi:Flavastacin precursor [compost metagenome]